MGDIKFCIPSFNRAGRIRTLGMLESFGVSKEDIYISTQTIQDFESYSNAYSSRANILYASANSAAGNRNNILDYFEDGTKIVFIDDDITKTFLLKLDKDNNKSSVSIDGNIFINIIKDMFLYLEETNGYCFTFLASGNSFWMSRNISDKFGASCCMGVINNNELRFDTSLELMEDNELCLNAMSRGYHVVELKFIGVNARHKQSGGCCDSYKNQQVREKCFNTVLTRYNDIVKPGKQPYSLKMRKPTKRYYKNQYYDLHKAIADKYIYS